MKSTCKMQNAETTRHCDNENGNLEMLLEVFGSRFHIEDITTAYCEASCDVDVAAEILSAMTRSSSADKLRNANVISSGLPSGVDGASLMSSELSDRSVQKPHQGEKKARALKSKRCSASMGTVSGVIGTAYTRYRPLPNKSCEATKPVKINSKELPVTEIWSEEVSPCKIAYNGAMHTDVEDFLFKMLGEGFQLDMSVIRKVLGLCGYDLQKSMDKLLDLSASSVEKDDNVVHAAVERSTGKCLEQETIFNQTEMQHQVSAQSDEAQFLSRNLTNSSKIQKDTVDLQKEVLEALFSVPERSEEVPKKKSPFREEKRSRVCGQLLVEPLKETTQESKIAAAEQQDVPRDDYENSYEALRKAMKEYLVTMKEYYRAAVDAFVKCDHARANKLMEQGHFFKQKAMEADDKSTEKICNTRSNEIISLDLHYLEPKQAVRLLRLHLTSLSGITTVKYLRLTVETNEEDTSKGARKRLIMKQLQKESIDWTEEEDGHKMMIQVDDIDPGRLSFAKNKSH